MSVIPITFYQKEDTVLLSRTLIGKYLFTRLEGAELTGGMIIETEAYCGIEDRACHAYNNRRTQRTEVMFAEGGVAYVYLCYGMHYLFNIVTNRKDIPHAILIRAIKPEYGIDTMLRRRKKLKNSRVLTNGPGALCQALGITRAHNAIALEVGNGLWLEDRGVIISSDKIDASPRIGVEYAGEDAWKPWRFTLVD